MVSWNRKQIAIGQNHHHEITRFLSKLHRCPNGDYNHARNLSIFLRKRTMRSQQIRISCW
jgi:hypothetical protein